MADGVQADAGVPAEAGVQAEAWAATVVAADSSAMLRLETFWLALAIESETDSMVAEADGVAAAAATVRLDVLVVAAVAGAAVEAGDAAAATSQLLGGPATCTHRLRLMEQSLHRVQVRTWWTCL